MRSCRAMSKAAVVLGAVVFVAGAASANAATSATKPATSARATKPVAAKPVEAKPVAAKPGSTAKNPSVKPSTAPASAPTPTAPPTTPPTVRPSGSITVYSGRNEALIKPILEQFSNDTGVKVNFRAGDSGALGAQLLTEGSASPADVFFSQDAGALGAVSKAGLLDVLPSTLTNRVDAAFRATDNRWVGISGRLRVVIYNPTLAPTPPPVIDAILDPQWKGRIGYAPTNASWQSFVTALRVTRGESAAKDWLTKFRANDPKPYAGNAAVRDAVNDGTIALGPVNHYYLYEKMGIETRAKVVAKNRYFTDGDVGGLMNVAGVGVLKSSKNKDAARALVDYLLSTKAQKYFAEQTYEYPLISSVSSVSDIPKLSTLKPPAVDLSDLDSLAATQALLASTGLLTR